MSLRANPWEARPRMSLPLPLSFSLTLRRNCDTAIASEAFKGQGEMARVRSRLSHALLGMVAFVFRSHDGHYSHDVCKEADAAWRQLNSCYRHGQSTGRRWTG